MDWPLAANHIYMPVKEPFHDSELLVKAFLHLKGYEAKMIAIITLFDPCSVCYTWACLVEFAINLDSPEGPSSSLSLPHSDSYQLRTSEFYYNMTEVRNARARFAKVFQEDSHAITFATFERAGHLSRNTSYQRKQPLPAGFKSAEAEAENSTGKFGAVYFRDNVVGTGTKADQIMRWLNGIE